MTDPIKKNAQDYTRRDANNESDEYHHTCSFGLFQKDFRRKRGAVEECHEFGLGPVTSLGLPPFRSSHLVKSRTFTACSTATLVTDTRTVASPWGIPATHS